MMNDDAGNDNDVTVDYEPSIPIMWSDTDTCAVNLKHDGTAGTDRSDGTYKSYRFAAKINIRALTQTSHEVVHTCKRTTCVTTVKFLLVSHLASTTAVSSVFAVPSLTGQTDRRPCPV